MKYGVWKVLERKWEGKLFLSAFGWMERKENKLWGLGIFYSGLPKSFLLKMRRKLKGEKKIA